MASIFIRTVIVFFLLTLSMKIMGKREIGELEVSDLITSLLISEICSIPIDDSDIPLLNAIIPVIFIVTVEIIISFIKNKSLTLKKRVDGESVYIISNGVLNQDALRKNRISIEELLTEIRISGTGSFAEVDFCILEPNGKISVLKKGESEIDHLIISDGEVNREELLRLGYDEKWLKKKLGKNEYSDVFIFTASSEGRLNIILKEEKK